VTPEQRGHWLLGNFPELSRTPLRFFRELAMLGKVVRFRVLTTDCYFINHPGMIQHILTSAAYSRNTRDFHLFRSILGEGLVTSEGTVHRSRRRLLQPAFHHQRIQALLGPIITQATEAMIQAWRPGLTLDLVDAMLNLTLRIVGEALFGLDFVSDRLAMSIRTLETYLTEQFSSPLDLPSFLPTRRNRRLWHAKRLLHSEIARCLSLQQHDQDSSHNGFLSYLLQLPLTREQIRDEILTILLAGHETTASALVWAWCLLSEHPEVAQRLRHELREVLGERSPSVDDLPRLTYPLMVFKETLRMYPPAWLVSRRVEKEDVVAGFRLPQHAIVFLSPWVTHYDPMYWDEPMQFRPERFAKSLAPHPRSAYFPFGGGEHRCIGEGFALLEGQLILATVAQHYHVRVLDHPVKPGVFPALRPRGGVLPITLSRLPEEGTVISAATPSDEV